MEEKIRKQITEIIETHKKMVAKFETDGIETVCAAADAITKSFKQNGVLYLCGNGGSAADAQHIAGEMVGRFLKERVALPAVALSTDTSVLTCIGNDYDFDSVFSRQVEALVKAGDILWAISTSGESVNVVRAAELAKKKGASVLAFTGRADSKLEKIADICFCAKADKTFQVQQIHQLAYHIICGLVEDSFCEE